MEEEKYHTFMNYAGRVAIPGFIVPQKEYRTNTVYQPSPPVQFFDRGQFGIRLRDAIASNFSGLAEAQRPIILNEGGVRIAIRILWPGYASWEKWISVYGYSSNRPPITKSQLAYQIARKIHEFYEAKKDANAEFTGTPDWCLCNIPFDQLSLLELRHVSPGSWQPVLAFIR
ncbi:hypothetical protein BDY19DRAFT_591251 [Irpex rosettiformis]|uniref:Uncharacterized protein n=1 Tax=Irpex rosettiformis TaxID=378272 RepID=A0ACB8UDK1_9APHY|nr:hypothetical protein BDY19DRAFT_591251 [Irpex rosettiformis]